MFAPYRRILGREGAVAFSTAGVVARLPLSTVSLGTVLLISERTGSYAYAGGVSAAGIVASAVASPLQARLVDRVGQVEVLRVLAGVFALGMALLLLSVDLGWGTPWPHVFAALAGGALPQAGSMVRARWRHVLTERRDVDTAFAYEAVMDETVFVTGPVAVTFLATLVSPYAGLVVAAVAGTLGAVLLSAQRRTVPPHGRRPAAAPGEVATRRGRARPVPLGWSRLGPLALAAVGTGCVFGSVEVVTVAFATEAGDRSASGVLLAVWAVASLLAGVVMGAVAWRTGPLGRFRLGAAAMTVSMVPLLVVPDVGWAAVALFVSGFSISPTLVSAVSLVEVTVPRERLTEGLSWVSTGLSAGVAPGAALSGWVVDRAGASAAFSVPLAAAAVAALVALAMRAPADADPSSSGAADLVEVRP